MTLLYEYRDINSSFINDCNIALMGWIRKSTVQEAVSSYGSQ